MMENQAELVQRGRAARRSGQTAEALPLYAKAAEILRREGDLVRWAHTARHCAELQVELGRVEEARAGIEAVIGFYQEKNPGTLEMANALRIAALADEAAGRGAEARERWTETMALYEQVGVQAGVDECRKHLS
jgi:tetratricopeptide (TPR) repeat protein